MLKPLDRPDRLSTLMQYMIHPTFDSRSFPLLTARLTQNGIPPTPPIRMPHGCPATSGTVE